MFRIAWPLSLVLFAALAHVGRAQEVGDASSDTVPVNKELIDAAHKLTTAESAKYTFTVGDDKTAAKLHVEPLLRWSNPAAGEIHGNVFLWTIDDRPVAIGSLFKWFTPHTHMSHEFHALAEQPVRARYGEAEVWSPAAAGVSYSAIPDAPAPAASANQRLLQMKRMAKDFTATKLQRDGGRQEMRLLPQPIYRYAAAEQQVLDGALFVLVEGTDPEVFLLLKARGEADKAVWVFAAARMNSTGFEVRYRDKPAWSAEIMPWSDVGNHSQPYTTFLFKMP
jgi:hypothetical protein